VLINARSRKEAHMKKHVIAVLVVAAAGLLYSGATSAALPQQQAATPVAEPERAPERGPSRGEVGVLGTADDPDPFVYTLDSGAAGGYAEWTEDGDTLKVCDIENVGDWHARAYIYIPDAPGSGTGQVLQAVSDNSDNGSCSAYFEDIPEGVSIDMKVCVTNSAGVINSTCNWTKR
jgi:hypothetical protein